MSEYPFFPVFVDLSDKNLLVIGAGKIARRRITMLCQFTPDLVVIAPEALPEVEALAGEGKIRFRKKAFEPEDLDGADIVFAATGSPAVNNRIHDECRQRGIIVNVSTDRNKCDFYFPGIARKGDVVAGVSASGKDHAGARKVSEAIREMLESMDL